MTLTPEHQRLLDVLYESCYGRDSGLTVKELTELFTGKRSTGALERRTRQLVNELRKLGCPICATPSHGYFWASCSEDLTVSLRFLRSRAMDSMLQISRLSRRAMPALAGQLSLPVSAPSPFVDAPPESYEGKVSLEVSIPEPLAEAVTDWVTRNPTWDQHKVLSEALRMFLVLIPEGGESC